MSNFHPLFDPQLQVREIPEVKSSIFILLSSSITFSSRITTIVVFNRPMFYYSISAMILGMKCAFKHQDLKMFGFKLNKYRITSIVVFNRPMCYYSISSMILEMKCAFKHQNLKMVGLKLNKYEQSTPT